MNSPTQTLPIDLNNNIPAVVVTFDDGYATDYSEAFAYMQTKNIKGTSFINSTTIDGAGYMTAANLATMYAAGWDIGNHTDTHTSLTTLGGQAAQETAIANCKSYLDGLGLTRASDYVAYPNGAYDADTLAAMAAQSMKLGRIILDSPWTLSEMAANWYEIPSRSMQNIFTLAEAKAYLDNAICQGRVAILYFHKLVASSPTLSQWLISDFQALMDYINSKNMVSLTISQLYGLHSAALNYNNPWYVP